MKVLVNDIYANLKGIPQDKMENVAIWGWSPEGVDLLTLAINERIHIKYFVDYNHTVYKNETIFDKRVIDREELLSCEDIFVIVGRKSFEEEQAWIENNLQGRYLVVDIREPAAEFRNMQGGIYIYGAGIAGGRTLEILREKGIEVEGFIDSNEQKAGTTWCDYPVYSRKVLQEEDRVIISALYWTEILDSLKKEFNPEHIYVDYRNCRVSDHTMRNKYNASILIKYQNYPVLMWSKLMMDYVSLLVDFKGKKIGIYGNNEIAEQVVEILECLGMSVSRVSDEIADFGCQDLENQMVLLTKVDDKASAANGCVVLDSGADFDSWHISNFSQWRSITSISGAARKICRDRLVSYVPEYEGHQYKGFYTHGTPSESKKRIVVLGGSTTDAGMYGKAITSWPEYLARKRDDVVIYNGGASGFISAEECLKMLRDVVHIKPDLVISYSGINDCYKIQDEKTPFKRDEEYDVFYGLESSMTRSEHWLLMERYMRTIASVMGADFIAILQTSVYGREEADRSTHEQLSGALYKDTYNEFVKEVQEVMNEYDWMYDLSKPFDGIKYEVFRDAAHLHEEGNQIIADKISDIIDDYYKNKEC